MTGIVISYRRSDTRPAAFRIFEQLEKRFGRGKVFIDIDGIPAGQDFRQHLNDVLTRCDVLLAVIGSRWTEGEGGINRLEQPEDWVRVEIEAALLRGIPVIPVLMDGAQMPGQDELPESLHPLTFRQAVAVDSGQDFNAHVERLIKAILTRGVPASLLQRLKECGNTRNGRTLALAVPLALLFLVFGQLAAPWIIRHLGRIDISTDGLLRAVSAERAAQRHGVPVAIVDIDTQTWKQWGEPVVTPRDQLVTIVQTLLRPGAGKAPLAIVLDIDLGTPVEPDALRPFLEQYPANAPPVVFPKRLEQGADGGMRMVPGPYDAVFQGRGNLVWADTTLDSDRDGVVRHWPLWREVCTGDGTTILPSVAARLAALVVAPDGGVLLPQPGSPRLSGNCREATGVLHQPRLLLAGVAGRHGVTGAGVMIATPRFVSIPARLVTDGEALRDDAALFGGKIVFVGASHTASRDFHRTAYGNLAGVEILAQQVHLAPLSGLSGVDYSWGFRLAVLVLLALLIAVNLLMKRLGITVQLLLLAMLAWGAIRWFHSFTVLEVILVAISLMIVLAGARKLWELIREWFAEPEKLGYFFAVPGRKLAPQKGAGPQT